MPQRVPEYAWLRGTVFPVHTVKDTLPVPSNAWPRGKAYPCTADTLAQLVCSDAALRGATCAQNMSDIGVLGLFLCLWGNRARCLEE